MLSRSTPMDWQEIKTFDGIDLSESYILSWFTEDKQVAFRVDFVLSPEHPAYSPPPPTEYACFRLGTLSFNGVGSVDGLPELSKVRAATDASGEFDYGHVESLSFYSGIYEVGFEFGIAKIEAESISVSLERNLGQPVH